MISKFYGIPLLVSQGILDIVDGKTPEQFAGNFLATTIGSGLKSEDIFTSIYMILNHTECCLKYDPEILVRALKAVFSPDLQQEFDRAFLWLCHYRNLNIEERLAQYKALYGEDADYLSVSISNIVRTKGAIDYDNLRSLLTRLETILGEEARE